MSRKRVSSSVSGDTAAVPNVLTKMPVVPLDSVSAAKLSAHDAPSGATWPQTAGPPQLTPRKRPPVLRALLSSAVAKTHATISASVAAADS